MQGARQVCRARDRNPRLAAQPVAGKRASWDPAPAWERTESFVDQWPVAAPQCEYVAGKLQCGRCPGDKLPHAPALLPSPFCLPSQALAAALAAAFAPART